MRKEEERRKLSMIKTKNCPSIYTKKSRCFITHNKAHGIELHLILIYLGTLKTRGQRLRDSKEEDSIRNYVTNN